MGDEQFNEGKGVGGPRQTNGKQAIPYLPVPQHLNCMPSLPLDPVPAYPSTSSHLPSLRSLPISLSNFPILLSSIFAFLKHSPSAFLSHPPALLLSITTLSVSSLLFAIHSFTTLFFSLSICLARAAATPSGSPTTHTPSVQL